MAFRNREGWVKRGAYLGKNKEAFDAEAFAILRAVSLLNEKGERGQRYIIFSDSQAAVSRVQHDRCGPAQALVRAIILVVDDLTARDNTLDIRWTPSHEGVDGNEQADATAKATAEERGGRAEPAYLGEASLSHLNRKTMETRSKATSEWIRARTDRDGDTSPQREGSFGREWREYERSWLDGFTNSFQDMPQRLSASGESVRPRAIDVGGAEAESVSLDTTFLSSAEGGV